MKVTWKAAHEFGVSVRERDEFKKKKAKFGVRQRKPTTEQGSGHPRGNYRLGALG